MTQRIFGLVGWKNSGKTTLVERLVQEITNRGYTVSTVKHAHHDADVDEPGRDSHRHRSAGAQQVMLVTENRWALMHELRGRHPPTAEEIASLMAPADLILMEGFKSELHPMLEVRSKKVTDPPIADRQPNVVAVAVEEGEPLETSVPVFDRDAVSDIASFILDHVGLNEESSGV